MQTAEAVLNGAWAVQSPEMLRAIFGAALGELPPAEALLQKRGELAEGSWSMRIRDGVAVIPVQGMLSRSASAFYAYYFGLSSTQEIAQALGQALEDPQIHSILFEVHSPGGEVVGVEELAGLIYAARGRKPIVAYIEGQGASAAYWLAAAADEVVVSRTALVGSIGVYMGFVDSRKRLKELGVESIEVVSSQSPRKRMDPTTKDGRAQIQTLVDQLAAVFVADVAKFRGVTEETVLADFGGGGLLIGADAVAAGMADRVATCEEVLAGLVRKHQEKGGLGSSWTGAAANARTGKESESMPTLWDRLKATLGGIEDPTAPDTPAAGAVPPAAPAAPAAPNAAEAALREQLAAQTRKCRELEAGAFADAQIAASRAVPSERQAMISGFLQAAEDDERSPLAQGASRVEGFKSLYTARPAHGLTTEQAPGGAAPAAPAAGAQGGSTAVLPNKMETPEAKQDGAEPTPERVNELLAASPLGRAVIDSRRVGGPR